MFLKYLKPIETIFVLFVFYMLFSCNKGPNQLSSNYPIAVLREALGTLPLCDYFDFSSGVVVTGNRNDTNRIPYDLFYLRLNLNDSLYSYWIGSEDSKGRDLNNICKMTGIKSLEEPIVAPLDTALYTAFISCKSGDIFVIKLPETGYAKIKIIAQTTSELKFEWALL